MNLTVGGEPTDASGPDAVRGGSLGKIPEFTFRVVRPEG